LDKDLTGLILREKIEQLLTKPDTLAAMHTAAQKISRPLAAKEIAQSALGLVKRK
jgi:UDP-N-acetylglucosamine:LPS N-acetylglucosamine transferase